MNVILEICFQVADVDTRPLGLWDAPRLPPSLPVRRHQCRTSHRSVSATESTCLSPNWTFFAKEASTLCRCLESTKPPEIRASVYQHRQGSSKYLHEAQYR